MTTTFDLDLHAGPTQVLADATGTSTNYYLCSVSRIGEQQGSAWVYPIADALGSARQLTNQSGNQVTLARTEEPHGKVLFASGSATII